MVLLSCSNSGSDDDSPATDTYSGSFTVNGASYSSLSVTNGTYTMTGTGGTDSGTYATSAAVLADGTTYTFTSNTHHGTFKVTISGTGLSLSNGTLTASGTGSVYVPPVTTSSSSSGGGAALFWNGVLVITPSSSNPTRNYLSSIPTTGTVTYSFTAKTAKNGHTNDTDYTSLCGTYSWYLGGEQIRETNACDDEKQYRYTETTVAGVTVTPSADSRSCTVTVDYSALPSGTTSIRLVVVDWNTPQGTSVDSEGRTANYMGDMVADWNAPAPDYNSPRPDKKFAIGRSKDYQINL